MDPIGTAAEAEAFIEDVLEQIRIRSGDNKKRGGWFNKSQVLCEAILVGKPALAEYIAQKWVNKSSESYTGDECWRWFQHCSAVRFQGSSTVQSLHTVVEV